MLDVADTGLNWHLSLADGKAIQFIATPRILSRLVESFPEADAYSATVQDGDRADLIGMLVPKGTAVVDLPASARGFAIAAWTPVTE